jgi:hypothetical protein
MEKCKTNSANSASQPVLPFSNAPIDWTEPVECRFSQLAAVTDAAARAGFEPVRMTVLASGYKLAFQRMSEAGDAKNAPSAATGSPQCRQKKIRNLFLDLCKARSMDSPSSSCETKIV